MCIKLINTYRGNDPMIQECSSWPYLRLDFHNVMLSSANSSLSHPSRRLQCHYNQNQEASEALHFYLCLVSFVVQPIQPFLASFKNLRHRGTTVGYTVVHVLLFEFWATARRVKLITAALRMRRSNPPPQSGRRQCETCPIRGVSVVVRVASRFQQ